MELVKVSFKIKMFILSLFIIFSVVSITILVQKSNDNDIKTFQEISYSMSKNINQFRNTPGITMTALAADSDMKIFKIGINIDQNKITSEQLKQAIELYLTNTSSLKSDQGWKNYFKPYTLRIEELASGKLIAEKPLGETDIIWK